jgi:hypothetical protein
MTKPDPKTIALVVVFCWLIWLTGVVLDLCDIIPDSTWIQDYNRRAVSWR